LGLFSVRSGFVAIGELDRSHVTLLAAWAVCATACAVARCLVVLRHDFVYILTILESDYTYN
jgi:hypothetical protein